MFHNAKLGVLPTGKQINKKALLLFRRAFQIFLYGKLGFIRVSKLAVFSTIPEIDY